VRLPEIVIRCAATLPAANTARGDRGLAAGHRQLPACFHRFEGQSDRVRDQPQRRAETRAQVIGSELLEGPGGATEAHQVEEQLGRIPL
jgi:hypothetical protein